MAAIVCNAADFEKDGLWYEITSMSNNTVIVTKPNTEDVPEGTSKNRKTQATVGIVTDGIYSGNIEIPKIVDYNGRTFRVSGISQDAFYNCNIGTLSIYDNIKTLNKTIFGQIDIVRFEDSEEPLTLIQVQFNATGSSKTRIYIGRPVQTDASYEFFKGNGLKVAEFGYIYKKIPRGIFSGCSSLSSVIIPSSVTTIERGAFANSGISSIESENIIEVESSAFAGSELMSAKLPNLKSISDGTFSNCKKMKEIIVNPSLQEIGVGAFSGCSSLTWEDLGFLYNTNSVIAIKASAFSGCTGLEKFIVPEGVVLLGNDCFKGCTNLKSVKIPKSVVSMFGNYGYVLGGLNVFEDCESLTSISVGYVNPPRTPLLDFDDRLYDNVTLKVPIGTSSIYKETDYWWKFKNIEEDASINDQVCSLHIFISRETRMGSVKLSCNNLIKMYGWADANDFYSGDEYDYGNIIQGDLPTKYATYYITTMPGSEIKFHADPDFNYKPYLKRFLNHDYVDISSELYDNELSILVEDCMNLAFRYGFEYEKWKKIMTDDGTFAEYWDGLVTLTEARNTEGMYVVPSVISDADGNQYNVLAIEEKSFENCLDLTAISFPESLKNIGDGSFAGCTNLQSIYSFGKTPIELTLPSSSISSSGKRKAHRSFGSSVFEGVDTDKCILYVPEGCVDVYRQSAVWGDFSDIREMDVTSIENVNQVKSDESYWYSIDGRSNTSKPSQKGMYIYKGKKYLVR